MLRELISIIRSTDPLRAMHRNFMQMTQIASDMTLTAGNTYFGERDPPVERDHIYQMDVKVNQLERAVRKQVVTHLSFPGNRFDVPYCLLLMSLVKDVERIGDYAKNLSEVVDFCPLPLPEDDIKQELLAIRQDVEEVFQSMNEVLDTSDTKRALEFVRQGRDTSRRCKLLVQRIATGTCQASVTTAQVLGCRYYKRIGGHALNVLSSVIMPLHKVDYYDEKEIARLEDTVA
jgi:phosphate uptake regulator